MNSVINQFIRNMGGRKFFYCQVWCTVATVLLFCGKIDATQWVVIISWFFSNVVIANNREAVAEINAAKQDSLSDTES